MLQCVCETNYVLVAFSSFVGELIFFLMNQLFVSIHKNTKTDLYDSISEESETDQADQEIETSENKNNENLLSTGTHYLHAEETVDDDELIPI